MAQFNFQLQGVLRHRTNIEHEKQRDFAVAQGKMAALETQLRALDAEVQASNEGVRRDHLVGRIDLSFLAAHRRYLAATQKRAMEIAQQMALAQRVVDATRLALTCAARDRKALEKLRDTQQAAWQARWKGKEMADQDEAAMQMNYRHSREAV